MDDLWRRLLRQALFLLIAAAFLGLFYGAILLWFKLADPYG